MIINTKVKPTNSARPIEPLIAFARPQTSAISRPGDECCHMLPEHASGPRHCLGSVRLGCLSCCGVAPGSRPPTSPNRAQSFEIFWGSLRDRGLLPLVGACGQRLASDCIVASKSTDGSNMFKWILCSSMFKLFAMNIDEYSGFLGAFPGARRDTDTVIRNLLAVLGPYYHHVPIIVSDNIWQCKRVRRCSKVLATGWHSFMNQHLQTGSHIILLSNGKFVHSRRLL
jgi:hypothetical protein